MMTKIMVDTVPEYITSKDIIAYNLDYDYETYIDIPKYTVIHESKTNIYDFISNLLKTNDDDLFKTTIEDEINIITNYIESNSSILSNLYKFWFKYNLDFNMSGSYLNLYGNTRQQKMEILESISPELREFVEPIFDEIINKMIINEIEQIKIRYKEWLKNDIDE